MKDGRLCQLVSDAQCQGAFGDKFAETDGIVVSRREKEEGNLFNWGGNHTAKLEHCVATRVCLKRENWNETSSSLNTKEKWKGGVGGLKRECCFARLEQKSKKND